MERNKAVMLKIYSIMTSRLKANKIINPISFLVVATQTILKICLTNLDVLLTCLQTQ